MGLYADTVLPRLIHAVMKNKDAARLRAKFVAQARGRVLEIGIGSGLNLPFYGPAVDAVHGIDPSEKLLAMARAAAADGAIPLELVNRSAETLPFEDGAFDTVVSTWTLCSIPDVLAALGEARRVLGPGGRLNFIEHGLAPEPATARWQNRITPVWRRCAGGCHLDRPIDRMIGGAGFRLDGLETGYLIKGPPVMTYTYAGQASPD